MKRSDRGILRSNVGLIASLLLLWPGQWGIQQSGWLDDYSIRIILLIGIRITAAVSLQLINGISGQFSLGHAGFMAIGAYCAAYPRISIPLPAAIATPLCYILLLAGAGLVAAFAGLLVGMPALRLRGDYLAIATLGFAEIVRVMLQTSPELGGALGLRGIPKVESFAWIYGLAIITIVTTWRLIHSARGRAMLAVREDEIAAASIGIDPAHSKVLAFVVGAFFAGTAGAALAHYEGYITPDNFNFMQSVELVVIVTLAGAGSIAGTIAVTALLTWLPEQLRGFQEYRMIFYSLLLILLMLLRPSGLLGGRGGSRIATLGLHYLQRFTRSAKPTS